MNLPGMSCSGCRGTHTTKTLRCAYNGVAPNQLETDSRHMGQRWSNVVQADLLQLSAAWWAASHRRP